MPKNTLANETLLSLRSRNCKENISSYKSEMRLMTSYQNPNAFITLSPTNIEKQLRPKRLLNMTPDFCRTKASEKQMFN